MVIKRNNRQYNTGVAPGEISPFCLLVGDPARAERVASHFSNVEFRCTNREYITITGQYKTLRVTVMGTGMGAANIEMAVIELSQCTEERLTLIRCGSCGGLGSETLIGDLVISTAAYRMENTTLAYVGQGYPSVAHPEVVLSLIRAADEAKFRFHVGITATAPSFYAAQGRHIPPYPLRTPEIVEELQSQGVINLEMEVSALLTMSSLGGHRAGAVCAVYAERVSEKFIDEQRMRESESRCIEVGLKALAHLSEMDQTRGSHPYWHPGLLT